MPLAGRINNSEFAMPDKLAEQSIKQKHGANITRLPKLATPMFAVAAALVTLCSKRRH
jgi:hypothetical protein